MKSIKANQFLQNWPMIFVVLLMNSDKSSASPKDQIVDNWKTYFQKIKSLHVETRVETQMRQGKMTKGQIWRHKATLSGSKYRYETHLPTSVKKFSFVLGTFDGANYQELQGSEEPTLTQAPDLGGKAPYSASVVPLIEVFSFVKGKGEILTLSSLQQTETWTKFQKRVVSVKKAQKDGHEGFELSVAGTKDGESWVIWVDESTYFPMSVKHFFKLGDSAGIDDFEVVSVKELVKEGLIFPISMKSSGYKDKKPFSVTTFDVDSNTLTVNQPTKVEIFNIPISQATFLSTKDGSIRVKKSNK